MTMPQLFDEPAGKVDRSPSHPRARSGDPITSHLAAEVAKKGATDLVAAITWVVRQYTIGCAPTAFEIVSEVEEWNPGRWDEGSIRTRISAMEKAGLLFHVDRHGYHKGRAVRRYNVTERPAS